MNSTASGESRRNEARGFWILLALLSFAVQVRVRLQLERTTEPSAPSARRLYITSGEMLRRFSLGYTGLLADIYWTRAVQYYGRERLARASSFPELGTLLRVTTTLDPHLLVAYRFGAIFLAEKPPGGAGDPRAALELLRRGIVMNPSEWRLWQDLGFIYYWDLHDFASAARVFKTGSERPGAALWMKALAAAVAAKGGQAATSRLLWTEIYRSAANQSVRQSALEHLAALEAQDEIRTLNALLAAYEQKVGSRARSFGELVGAGLLRGLPRDPGGTPFQIGPDGRAILAPESRVNLKLLQE